MKTPRRTGLRAFAFATAATLAACASGPPPPDWQSTAKSAIDRAVQAYLRGDTRVDAQEFASARRSVASTGRPELAARVELMRCAAYVASLVFEPCDGFEKLRADAAPPERAYADYLLAKPLSRDEVERLPAAHRGNVQSIDDPLSRLIAIAVRFQQGQASPAQIALAVDTASEQGWRRPLLAWLKVQAQLAQRAGDDQQAQRLQRRIDLVQGTP